MNLDFSKAALIVIDIQNDFCPGGALEVPKGDEIIEGVNALASQFQTVVLSQDWHPKGHASFASSHQKSPYETIQMPYGEQTLWPDHCVQGTSGAEFHPALADTVNRAQLIVRKGMNPEIDSYSAFFENDRQTTTGLAGWLREKGITQVVLVGLAYDFCVAYSAMDATALGFEAVVIKDLCRGIGIPLEHGTTIDATDRMFENVVRVVNQDEVETCFKHTKKNNPM